MFRLPPDLELRIVNMIRSNPAEVAQLLFICPDETEALADEIGEARQECEYTGPRYEDRAHIVQDAENLLAFEQECTAIAVTLARLDREQRQGKAA